VFPIGRGSSPIQEQRRLRERARDVRARLANVPDHVGEFGSVLFPNSQLVFDQQLSIESRQLERSFGAPDKFIPVVVGLVDYTFSLSTERHETGFIADIFLDGKGSISRAAVGEIQANQLRVVHQLTGSYAT
jgi:hypothetical protein